MQIKPTSVSGLLGMAVMVASGAAAQTAPSGTVAGGESAAAPARPVRDLRYVVFHQPGPAWVAGKSPFEQPGLEHHIAHYRQWQQQGKLALGGPFMDAGSGGMMLPEAGQSEQEIRAFAAADPAVKSGLLSFEVRPWLVGMRK